jgi:hypothetical protein
MQGNHIFKVLVFWGEAIRQSGKSSHAHSHSQVLSLYGGSGVVVSMLMVISQLI